MLDLLQSASLSSVELIPLLFNDANEIGGCVAVLSISIHSTVKCGSPIVPMCE